MTLGDREDFDQLVLQAADHFRARSLRPAIIEKDYYVTEALRVLAQTAGDKIIFKGGTSLSKGWNLIDRFSEDIDLFLDPKSFTPPLGKGAIDTRLKGLRNAVGAHPHLTLVEDESVTIGGFGRSDRFAYNPRFGGVGEVAARVLLESGTASGREPTETVQLRSYLSEFLRDRGITLGTEDEAPFSMQLLHFRRTFVEKMFAIHSKVELFKQKGQPIGSYARHYYDLARLGEQPDVQTMLKSDEYAAIKADYETISLKYFAKNYFAPPDMRFSKSDALFPTGALSDVLGAAYESQCTQLCYGVHPPWTDVLSCFGKLKGLL